MLMQSRLAAKADADALSAAAKGQNRYLMPKLN
jgi:hypothetical protein